jgi:hypothetical protein
MEEVGEVRLDQTQGRLGRRSFLDALIAGLFLLWYSNLPLYIGTFYIPWMTPVALAAVTVGLVVVGLILEGGCLQKMEPFLPIWVIVVILLNAAWSVGFGGAEFSILSVRVMYLALMLAAFLAFAVSPWMLHVFRKGVLWVSCLMVPLLCFDLTHPFTFHQTANSQHWGELRLST